MLGAGALETCCSASPTRSSAAADVIAAFESFDTGQPITQARGLAARSAENFRYFAEVCGAIHEDAFRAANQFGYVVRRPKGVAGLITPWNAPFMLATWKLAPCLAAGCTVVLKPAELTPLTASLFPEIVEEAGLPTGVFNIVHGIGEEAGAALVAHPDVPVISFTGETATGKLIMASAADHLKGLSMELGGKSPCIVFADADLDTALDSALFGVFSLNGERCTAGSRVLVERSIYDDFVEDWPSGRRRSASATRPIPTTEVGALVSDRALRAGAVVRRRPASPRAPVSSPAAAAPSTCRRATTSRRPCSPTSRRRCGSSARRSSGRSCA